jgi:hypothetical protein
MVGQDEKEEDLALTSLSKKRVCQVIMGDMESRGRREVPKSEQARRKTKAKAARMVLMVRRVGLR